MKDLGEDLQAIAALRIRSSEQVVADLREVVVIRGIVEQQDVRLLHRLRHAVDRRAALPPFLVGCGEDGLRWNAPAMFSLWSLPTGMLV